jgi:hypothetical protein
MHSHFGRREIKTLINDHTIRFTDTVMNVEVATGRCFEPMKLLTHMFQPKDNELLQLHHVTPEAAVPSSLLMCQYSAPIAILGFSPSDMKALCKDHVEKMIKNPEYALQTTSGDPTNVPFFVLEAAMKFYFATKVGHQKSKTRNEIILTQHCSCHYFTKH